MPPATAGPDRLPPRPLGGGPGALGGLTGYDTRRAYGAGRRAILTHSPELHENQARGFTGTTLAKAGKKLDELAATLARGKRRPSEKVEAEIEKITAKPWVRRVITWQLSGDQRKDLRLAWQQTAKRAPRWKMSSSAARADHRSRRWPVAEVVAGYGIASDLCLPFRRSASPHSRPGVRAGNSADTGAVKWALCNQSLRSPVRTTGRA